jgi:hypothetical protein
VLFLHAKAVAATLAANSDRHGFARFGQCEMKSVRLNQAGCE